MASEVGPKTGLADKSLRDGNGQALGTIRITAEASSAHGAGHGLATAVVAAKVLYSERDWTGLRALIVAVAFAIAGRNSYSMRYGATS
jgi:hypothetical protein